MLKQLMVWCGVLVLVATVTGYAQGNIENASNLQVRTSDGHLYVNAVTAVGATQGPLTNFANIGLRTYSGDLGIIINGGTATPDVLCVNAAAADFCLSDGGNGIGTFASVNGTNNEDLDLDLETNANRATWASSTGVVTWQFTGTTLFIHDVSGFRSAYGGDYTLDLDDDNNGTNEFVVRNGGNVEILNIAEDGSVTFAGTVIGGEFSVEAVTTSKTTTLAESGELYTNTGDSDGTDFTLLNDPTIGAHWFFVATAGQTMTIVASSGETIEDSGATCGTSYTLTDGQSVQIAAATGGSGAQYHIIGGSGTCNA